MPTPPRFHVVNLHRESPHDDRVTGLTIVVGHSDFERRITIRNVLELDQLIDELEKAEVAWLGESYCEGRAEERAEQALADRVSSDLVRPASFGTGER